MKKYFLLLFAFTSLLIRVNACTIFSAIDKNGHVWAGNNEDNIFNFNPYLTVVPASDSTFGYMFFTNTSRSNEFMQGGVNEAGLFYDGNSVPPSKYKDYNKKKDYPGGNSAMLIYIMQKCKTAQEVLALFEKYRMPGLEGGQMHFADKYGSLGIIVADSMWITKASYQVSTNYNLCHADKDKQTCWRFPIAERILTTKEPGIDSFREICDSTSQKKIASTIYTNIHDLNTGDSWFYFGMNFNNAYKTNITELLAKGKRSFPVCDLFPDDPLIVVYKTYKAKGIESTLQKLNEYSLPEDRKKQILRLLYYDLIVGNHDFSAYTPLSDAMKVKKENDELVELSNAVALFCTGRKTEALALLQTFSSEKNEKFSPFLKPLATHLLNQMQGNFAKDANVKFELKGYENAKYVFVEGIDTPNLTYFLIQKEGKWIGKFKLEPDEYGYTFLIDGKRVMDPKNSKKITIDGLDYNKIVVKK